MLNKITDTMLFRVLFFFFFPTQALHSHIEILSEKKILLDKLRIHEHLILQLANFHNILEGPNKFLLATVVLLSIPFWTMCFLVIVLMEPRFRQKARKKREHITKNEL